MNKRKFKHSPDFSKQLHKFGVEITPYQFIDSNISAVFESVEEGHFKEFLNKLSTFVWFIAEGEGTFVINDEPQVVKKNDLIIVPPNTRVHYFGKMKMLLLNIPAFDETQDELIRDVKKEESPYAKRS